MPTFVHTPTVEIARRQRLGIDGRDEVWAGTYRMIPPPSFTHQCIGEQLSELLTAALVLEILSPRDKTWQKLAFYAARGVQELLIVDPRKRTV